MYRQSAPKGNISAFLVSLVVVQIESLLERDSLNRFLRRTSEVMDPSLWLND